MKKSTRVVQILWGGVCGIVNGFLGSGGGIIAVQLMERAGMDGKKAHASSLLVIFPLCAVSGAVYFMRGSIAFDTDTLLLLAGAAAGGILGAVLLGKLTGKFIDILFTLLILASGVWMIFR